MDSSGGLWLWFAQLVVFVWFESFRANVYQQPHSRRGISLDDMLCIQRRGYCECAVR